MPTPANQPENQPMPTNQLEKSADACKSTEEITLTSASLAQTLEFNSGVLSMKGRGGRNKDRMKGRENES